DDLLPGTLRTSLYLNTALALDKGRREGNLQLGCELLASFVRIKLKEAGSGVAAPQDDAEAVAGRPPGAVHNLLLDALDVRAIYPLFGADVRGNPGHARGRARAVIYRGVRAEVRGVVGGLAVDVEQRVVGAGCIRLQDCGID